MTLEQLPEPRGPLEADYQAVIRALHTERTELENRMAQAVRGSYRILYDLGAQIKTPIAAMRLLLQSGEGAQYRELSEELQRIEQYVEMVLCYLRLDSDSTDYVLKEYELDELSVRPSANTPLRLSEKSSGWNMSL